MARSTLPECGLGEQTMVDPHAGRLLGRAKARLPSATGRVRPEHVC